MKEDQGAKRTMLLLLIVFAIALAVVLWFMFGGAPNTPESTAPIVLPGQQ